MTCLHRIAHLADNVPRLQLVKAFLLGHVIVELSAAGEFHYQVEVLFHHKCLVQLDDVSVGQVLQNLGFFVYLVNLVCLLCVLRNINRFYGDHFLRLFVVRAKNFAEAALTNQLVNLVLVKDLPHIEGSALQF